MSFWVKTKYFIKRIFPKYVWDIPNKDNKVFLTFDDGPTPEITKWTLEQLKNYNAKATFFCIGNNIEKHPEIYEKVIQEGHSIGNHTFNHLKGWKTPTAEYIQNVTLCNNEMAQGKRQKAEGSKKLKSEICNLQSALFRPPYGKIKPSQSRILRNMGYQIIMWDIISFDFDAATSPEQCLDNVLKHIKPGSIVVFHDSVKAERNLRHALPKTLEFLKENGLICERID